LTITKDSFDALLEWLHPDRDTAARKYETIRGGLIRMFVSHGLADAEHYADETVDRVIKRLPEIRATYVNDPARYFHGVARNVLREALRRREIATDVLPERPTFRWAADSDLAECLRKCWKALPVEKRALIYDYHVYDGHQKIDSHREMAGELAISVGALRTRAHHVRAALERCVQECLQANRHKTVVGNHNSSGVRKERQL
jgi:DNA-directed RNA polymerase specialized sigma24 family protein